MKNNFIKIVKRLKASGFLKSTLTLSSGVVVSQAISFVGLPIISRIYSAADMGDFTIITSNASVIISIAVLGMMTVIMLPENDDESKSLARLLTLSTVILSALIVGILYVISPYWKIFNTTDKPYGNALIILYMFVLGSSINSICYAYVNRQKLYKVMFWNPILGTGISVGCSIFFGVMGLGFVGYVMSYILSYIVNIIHLVIHANPYKGIINNSFLKPSMLLKKYKRFIIFQMPANLLSNVGIQIPIQIIEETFSSSVLGMYSMTNRIMSIPISLLANSVNRVYFQEASQRYNRGEDIAELGFKILETYIKIAIIPVSVLIIAGQPIFVLFLGEKWREAGAFASVLGIYYLVQFCVSCLSGSFVIIGKNSWNLICSLVKMVIGIVLLLLTRMVPTISIYLFLFIMAGLSTLEQVVEEGIYFIYMGLSIKKYLKFVTFYIVVPFFSAFIVQWLIYNIQ